jgi:hypothetical protein
MGRQEGQKEELQDTVMRNSLPFDVPPRQFLTFFLIRLIFSSLLYSARLLTLLAAHACCSILRFPSFSFVRSGLGEWFQRYRRMAIWLQYAAHSSWRALAQSTFLYNITRPSRQETGSMQSSWCLSRAEKKIRFNSTLSSFARTNDLSSSKSL